MRRNNDTAARRADILRAAVLASTNTHYQRITRDQVAKLAGVSGSLVQHYFGTMPKLRRDVMRFAVRNGVLTVIAQGLVAGDSHAQGAQEIHKKAALDAVRG